VFKPDRRIMPRFKLQTVLAFSRTKSLSDSRQKAKTINISTTGVCFATSLTMSVGEVVEVLLGIPRRVTGVRAIARKFTGRITYIDPHNGPPGNSRVGVQFLYYEAVRSLSFGHSGRADRARCALSLPS
jgi:hypothetical protein